MTQPHRYEFEVSGTVLAGNLFAARGQPRACAVLTGPLRAAPRAGPRVPEAAQHHRARGLASLAPGCEPDDGAPLIRDPQKCRAGDDSRVCAAAHSPLSGEAGFTTLLSRSLASSGSGLGERQLAPTCSVPRRRE